MRHLFNPLLWVALLAATCLSNGLLEEEMRQMPDLLARVALAKEGNDADAAHQALTVFNAVGQEHVKQTLESMGDTISHLGQPSLEYFKDNNASQVIDDFLGFVNGPVASLLIMGPDGLDYSPCIASTQPRGIDIHPALIFILPVLVDVITAGIGIYPAGIVIRPTLAFIHPTAVDVAPTGISIAPSLLTVAGADVLVAPQGIGDASTLLAVAGKPPIDGGRRHLQSRTMEDFAKVFNASYGAWVGLVSDLAMRQGSTMQESQTIMNDVLTLAQAALKDLKALPANKLTPPIIQPGVPIRDLSRNVTGFSALVSIAASFISYGPCLFAADPSGIQIAPSAVDIGPTGILVVPDGIEIKPQGIFVLPSLLKVNPGGVVIAPTGISITPSLMSIFPVLHVLSAPAALRTTRVGHLVSDP